jgi:N-acetylmuramoyl-L-alanine amidase
MKSVVISSGHGLYIRGAADILDEVDEARKVVEKAAEYLRSAGVTVKTFHDDSSKDQGTNLNTIVNYHNKQKRDLDVSVHFNAYQHTSKPMGVECLYKTQEPGTGLAQHFRCRVTLSIADPSTGAISSSSTQRTSRPSSWRPVLLTPAPMPTCIAATSMISVWRRRGHCRRGH